MNHGPDDATAPVGPELRRLLDEAEIRRVLVRYAHGIDRHELELVRSCYHADAIDDHGTFRGPRDEFVEWVGGQLERYSFTTHHLTNVHIEWRDGVAFVETQAVAAHGGEPPEDRSRNFLTGFRYLDRFEHRPGDGWRIAARRVVNEWAEAWAPDRSRLGRFGAVSRTDRADAWYELLADGPTGAPADGLPSGG